MGRVDRKLQFNIFKVNSDMSNFRVISKNTECKPNSVIAEEESENLN